MFSDVTPPQIMSELCDIEEDEYAPYPPAFPTANQTYGQQLYINDPFNATNIPAFGEPTFGVEDSIPLQVMKPEASGCSICGLRANTLAILEPCAHPLCSACLTRYPPPSDCQGMDTELRFV